MGASAAILFTVAQSGNEFFSQQNAATDAQRRGTLERELAERNAALVEKQKGFAAKQYGAEEAVIRGDVRSNISQTRAALAGQGVDVGVGSAVDAQATQEIIGAQDIMTLKNNAALSAWGYDTSAADIRFQGRLAELAGKNEAAALKTQSYSTLLTGAANTYGVYSATKKPKAPKPSPDVYDAGKKKLSKSTFHGSGRLPFGSDY